MPTTLPRAALTDLVLQAHGGLQKWSEIEAVEITLNLLGQTFTRKGVSGNRIATALVSTREQRVTYRGLAENPDQALIFTPDRVWKQNGKGEIIQFRDQPRAAFEGHVRDTAWDDLHLIYFAGYALWQYINFPFMLVREGIETRELDPHHEAGETWRVLEATFHESSGLAVHGKVQKFYFNRKMVLQRHDYDVWVIGGASAAHYTFDTVAVGGIPFPTLRRVVARKGEMSLVHVSTPSFILLVYHRIRLHFEEGQGEGEGEGREDVVWERVKSSKI